MVLLKDSSGAVLEAMRALEFVMEVRKKHLQAKRALQG